MHNRDLSATLCVLLVSQDRLPAYGTLDSATPTSSHTSIHKLENKPHIIYGHFLYLAGRHTVAGNTLGIPSVIGVGGERPWSLWQE